VVLLAVVLLFFNLSRRHAYLRDLEEVTYVLTVVRLFIAFVYVKFHTFYCLGTE
jgi:hypothetical protein